MTPSEYADLSAAVAAARTSDDADRERMAIGVLMLAMSGVPECFRERLAESPAIRNTCEMFRLAGCDDLRYGAKGEVVGTAKREARHFHLRVDPGDELAFGPISFA